LFFNSWLKQKKKLLLLRPAKKIKLLACYSQLKNYILLMFNSGFRPKYYFDRNNTYFFGSLFTLLFYCLPTYSCVRY
jgi:hypothetical protein